MAGGTATRLLARLREEAGLDIPADAELVSLRPSRSARAAGAWSWAAYAPEGHELCIGSQFAMGKLLRAPGLEVHRQRDTGDWHVVPRGGV